MRIVSVRVALLLLFINLTAASVAKAQNLYKVEIKGSCSSLDASGNSVSQPLNNKELIREWASRVGVSNVNDLLLAFHPNSGAGGHSIDLVRNDGTILISVFPLAFLESAATPDGKSARRFAYVYDLNHADFSVGTALMNERLSVDKNGNTNRVVLDGTMQWYWLPIQSNPFRICTAQFRVGGKALRFD